jgi:mannosyl-oligosaccharide alpha-1,2-mannosidase
MLRLRRYRIFWILAVFVIGTLYHFKAFRDREGINTGGLRKIRHQHKFDHVQAADTPPLEEIVSGARKLGPQEEEVREQEQKQEQEIRKTKAQQILHDSTPTASAESEPPAVSDKSESPTTSSEPESTIPSVSSNPPGKYLDPAADPNNEEKGKPVADGRLDALPKESAPAVIEDNPEEPGKGRVEVPINSLVPKIYWSKVPEHFPIPSASIIQLPTGIPKLLPKIQHVFTDESVNDRISREQKLGKIVKTFEISWAGYRERAWMQDELSPVSGKHRNPFCGWAATLVDSLDTLWIMGMKEEFEKATKAVEDIDFTTSAREDIPLFETVIRYLGGLLAAYDLSGGTYAVLLEKAIELAEILMGAFDTPNRMPITYYFWKP